MGGVAPIDESKLHGHAKILNYIGSFINSMALKCAVNLHIADIIHKHGHPITLSQIASEMDPPSPDVTSLDRIMKILVRDGIFASTVKSDGDEPAYGLNPASEWLLQDAELSLAPFLLFQTHPLMMNPFHYLTDCARRGGTGFKKVNGCEIFGMTSSDPEFGKIFNDAMKCVDRVAMRAVLSAYGDGFQRFGSLVDVGGGVGQSIAEIVKAFPGIKGINYDLPHVIAAAPEFDGVTHVAGDMFKFVPPAEAIFIKHILHNWGDEECVKILKNCRKAISREKGKVIIVDTILKEEAGKIGNADVMLDLVMMVNFPGGRQRSEAQWKKVLEKAGFGRYNIIQVAHLPSLIEAYPDGTQD